MLTLLLPLTLLSAAGLLSAARASDDSFFPGEGPERVSFGDQLARGAVAGRTGRLLVRADDAATVASFAGVSRVDVLPGGLLRVIPGPGVDDLALSRALHELPGVRFAHPDVTFVLAPATIPDDPLLPDQWHLDNTGQGGRTPGVDANAVVAWEYATGAGQLVAVLDSGVQLDHPDLRVIPGRDYVDADDDPSPSTGSDGPHGTCAAGVAAAAGDNTYGVAGVAWGAEVYAIRLIGGATSLDDLYNAFAGAVDAGATVLSNSWGWSGDGCPAIGDYSTFREMFTYAEQVGRGGRGAVVVFAAGNSACDIEDDAMLNYKQPIVVAALESNDVRASYSNYGDAVDIAAPTSLLTTDIVDGGYGSYGDDGAIVDGFGGTSAATPVVAGTVALMLEANPRLTAQQVRHVLCDTAVRVDLEHAGYDEDGHSPWYGCGRVDAGAAVAAVANTEPAAPVPTLVSAEVWEGRAMLAWEPAVDPDGDVVAYEGAWAIGDSAPADPTFVAAGTTLDIGEALTVGDRVTWWVRAVDVWGAGPASAPVTFTVVAIPEPPPADTGSVEAPEPSTCATVPAPARGVVGALLAAVTLVRRRRTARA